MAGVFALVPAYNEALTIGDTVKALGSLGLFEQVIVIDDCSSDGTGRIAADSGARVVVNGRNLGKGVSLGRVAGELDFDILVMVDGDLGASAGQAGRLVEPVLSGEADMAIAAFAPPARKGGFGLVQNLARWAILRLTGAAMRSPLSGQRAITGELFREVSPLERGFGVETALTIDALSSGYRVVEVDTDMTHRETGRDLPGFIHRGRQFRDVARVIISRFYRRYWSGSPRGAR